MSMMSEKIDELAEALSKAQSTIENTVKEKSGYNYKYSDLAQVLEAIKKPLSDQGLSISQLLNSEVIDTQVTQFLTTLLMHKSGQFLSSKIIIESVTLKQGNSLQNFGAGVTYMRRYALAAIVGIAQEDFDASTTKVMDTQKEEQYKILTKFIELCRTSQLDVKEFAAFACVDSSKPASVLEAYNNFESLKNSFLEAQGAVE